MARLTIENTIYRNLTKPYLTGRPAHASIAMMQPTGHVVWVVVATATKTHEDVDPEVNKYGRTMINEKMALQWLRMDTCPLATNQASPIEHEGPCKNGTVCIHLPVIKEQRLAAHKAKESAYAEAWTKKEERKDNQKANAALIGDAVSRAVKGNTESVEVKAMKEEMAAMKATVAEMLESNRGKPGPKKVK